MNTEYIKTPDYDCTAVLEILKGAKKHLAHSFDSEGKQHYICFAINDFALSQEFTEELCKSCHKAKRLVEAWLSKLAPGFSSMHFSSNHAKIVLDLSSDSGKVTLDQIQEARHKFLDQLIADLEQVIRNCEMREILIEAKSKLQTEKLELGKDVYICVAISNTKTFHQDEKREAIKLVQSKLKEQMPHTSGSVFTREHVTKTLYGNVDYCPISKADVQRARHIWLNRLIEELSK